MSAENEIKQFVKSGVALVENRDLDDLNDLMDDTYLDRNGYNKKQVAGLLRVYFFRHSNIHLFTRIDNIELLTENQAEVQLHLAVAGSKITDAEALFSLQAQIYRFKLQLVKQEKWLLREAVWERVNIDVFQ